jgi:hypothetical protein
MELDSDLKRKLQIFLGVAIVLVGARTAYVVYDRYQERKEAERPVQPRAGAMLKADDYVTPKKLHPYDLKSARLLKAQPVWVKVGYAYTYYPYDVSRRRTDFAHDAGTLLPLQKLQVQDVVAEAGPQAQGTKQVLARFELEGKAYAVPIGVEKGGDFKIYSDEMFFIEDPHDLYKHWSADVWKAVDSRQVQPGMSELQADFAIGLGVPGGGAYGSRTLKYANGGKPLTITFQSDKAVEITPGS